MRWIKSSHFRIYNIYYKVLNYASVSALCVRVLSWSFRASLDGAASMWTHLLVTTELSKMRTNRRISRGRYWLNSCPLRGSTYCWSLFSLSPLVMSNRYNRLKIWARGLSRLRICQPISDQTYWPCFIVLVNRGVIETISLRLLNQFILVIHMLYSYF